MYTVPITLTRVNLQLGKEPEIVEERRHLYYTNDSVRKVFNQLGIDFRSLLKRAKKERATKKAVANRAQKKGAPTGAPSGESAPVTSDVLMAGVSDLKSDDFEQMAALIWGGLIEEDPSLSVADVSRCLNAHNIVGYVEAAMEALMIWQGGPEAGRKAREGIEKARLEADQGEAEAGSEAGAEAGAEVGSEAEVAVGGTEGN